MWNEVYSNVLPHVVRIQTPSGTGTGFLIGYNASKQLAAIATAAHVVEEAEEWRHPIKIQHEITGAEIFVTHDNRAIEINSKRDSASIVLKRFGDGGFEPLGLPSEPVPMIDHMRFAGVGNEIGWVGYPGIASPKLCFFTGRVSAFLSDTDSYLIDGVAINGVSGGPVFQEYDDGEFKVIGVVSAYMPNRHRGDVLPGMAVAQDVTAFQQTIARFKSLDDAKKDVEISDGSEKPAAE